MDFGSLWFVSVGFFIVCDKCTPLVGEAGNVGGYSQVVVGGV